VSSAPPYESSGSMALVVRASAIPPRRSAGDSATCDHASQAAVWRLIPPTSCPCSLAPSLTTSLYSTTVSQPLRNALRGGVFLDTRGPREGEGHAPPRAASARSHQPLTSAFMGMPSQSSGPYRPTSSSANSSRISGEAPHPGLLPHLSRRRSVGQFTLVYVSPNPNRLLSYASEPLWTEDPHGRRCYRPVCQRS
jgi:hypothetical protein